MTKASELKALRPGGLAVDIWMQLDLVDCATRGCPYLHESTREAQDVCIAASEQKCPEARRQLWKLREGIKEYYLTTDENE